MRNPTFTGVLGLLLLLPLGCGGGGGGSSSDAPPLRVLDLTDGTLGPAVRSLGSDAALGRTKIVFVQIPAGSVVLGQPTGSLGHQADEIPGAPVAVATFWCARHELTQAQWLALVGDGDRPWLRLAPVGVTGSRAEDDLIPALGITLDAAQAALSAWNAGAAVELVLPSEAQWEYACRGGSGGLFHWGDSLDPVVVGSYAHLGATAPAAVAGRGGNGYALYDMHGNAREWTAEGHLRGGGWADHVLRARVANRLDGLDGSTQHAQSGMRPVLIIP